MTNPNHAKSTLFLKALSVAFITSSLALTTIPNTALAKTLRYASQDDAQTLDPHSANLAVTTRLLSQVYEGLVGRDANFKIVPWLATSWSQPDAKTWRFKLRPDVKFHDGSVMTADDVVFSMERVLSVNSQMKITVQGVASAKKVDNLTVDFLMKDPNPALLAHLFSFRIMNKAWSLKNNSKEPQDYKAKEDTFVSRNTNGTGPFILKERQADVRVVLTAHKEWWNRASADRGNVTDVIILPIKSNSTRIAALISGDVDFVLDPPQQDIARLRTSADLTVIGGSESRVQFIGFDQHRDELIYSNIKGKNPFKDLRVRQAVSHAIDIQTIKTKVMRGLSNPIGSVVTNDVVGYSKAADMRLDYNPEKAKALLTAAGYPNGFEVTFDCGNIQPAADICLSVAPMLARVGIKATPNIINQANVFPKLQKFDSSMYLISWGSTTFDALYTLQSVLRTYTGDATGRTTSSGGDSNYGRYSNIKLDALIDKIMVETETTKRNGFMGEALALVNSDIAVLPLHQALAPWIMRKNVSAVYAPNQVAYMFRINIK